MDAGIPPQPIVYPRSTRGFRTTAAKSTSITFADLDGSDAWAKEAIVWVAKTNSWMLDFAPHADGTYNFRPDAIETRKYFARSDRKSVV